MKFSIWNIRCSKTVFYLWISFIYKWIRLSEKQQRWRRRQQQRHKHDVDVLIVQMIDCTFTNYFTNSFEYLVVFFSFVVGFEIQTEVHFKIIFHGKITTHFSNCNWISWTNKPLFRFINNRCFFLLSEHREGKKRAKTCWILGFCFLFEHRNVFSLNKKATKISLNQMPIVRVSAK